MKRLIFACLTVLTLALLAGCGGKPQKPEAKYVVITSDYAVHMATTQPVVDETAATISFQDDKGQTVTIPRDDLKQLKSLKGETPAED